MTLMTLNAKIKVFMDFWAILGCDTHFKSEYWVEITTDRPVQSAYEIFGP